MDEYFKHSNSREEQRSHRDGARAFLNFKLSTSLFSKLCRPRYLIYRFRNTCYIGGKKVDLFDRGHKYEVRDLDSSFPDYLINNIHIYKKWLIKS